MTEPAPGEALDSVLAGLLADINALHESGALQFDPVSFHYLAALARRTAAQTGAVHAQLTEKLAGAVTQFRQRVEQAKVGTDAQSSAPPPTPQSTHTLADLLARLNATETSQPELKAIHYFRDDWSRLSVDRQVTQAIEQGPDNAGPLNSHQLVLHALTRMRDTAPGYLSRFLAYAESLLCLDQAATRKESQSRSKPKARRSKAR